MVLTGRVHAADVALTEHAPAPPLSDEVLIRVKKWVAGCRSFLMDSANATALDAGLPLDEVAESVAVEYAVMLVPNLGNPRQSFRIGCLKQLHLLACALRSPDDPLTELGDLTVPFQYDCSQYNDAIANVFAKLGKSLSLLALGLVAGLEGMYFHSEQGARNNAICAVTQLVMANRKLFSETDNMVVVWNLLLTLQAAGSGDMSGKRGALISALGAMAEFYTHDQRLTGQIVVRLLHAEDKTRSENAAVTKALQTIFRHHVSRGDHSMFSVFLRVLTPRHESYYDMLSTAIRWYCFALAQSDMDNAKQPADSAPGRGQLLNSPPTMMLDYARDLYHYMRAASSLLRYGAALSIFTLIDVCPSLIDDLDDLYPMIVDGCFDGDHQAATTHLATLRLIAVYWDMEPVVDLIDNHAHQATGNREAFQSALTAAATDCAVHMPLSMLQAWISAAPHVAPARRLALLRRVRLWASKLVSVDTVFINALLPCLRDLDVNVQLEAIAIVRALAPLLTTDELPMASLRCIEAYLYACLSGVLRRLLADSGQSLRTTAAAATTIAAKAQHAALIASGSTSSLLAQQASSSAAGSSSDSASLSSLVPSFGSDSPDLLLPLVLALGVLPYHEFEDKDIVRLVQEGLFRVAFVADRETRLAVYHLIGRQKAFWRSSSLTQRVFTLLLLSLGDSDKSNVTAVVHALEALDITPAYAKLRDCVLRQHERLVAADERVRIAAFDAMATEISKEITVTSEAAVAAEDSGSSGASAFRPLATLRNSSEMCDFLWDQFVASESRRPTTSQLSSRSDASPSGFRDNTNVASVLQRLHEPFWAALLLTKLGVRPSPAVTGQSNAAVTAYTMLQSLKRHLGSASGPFRRAACLAAVRCCFVDGCVQFPRVAEVLEMITPWMDPKSRVHAWTYRVSAMNVLLLLVPFKIRGLNRVILMRFVEKLIEFLERVQTSHAAEIQSASLQLLEFMLPTLPASMSCVLERLTHAVRMKLTAVEPVQSLARRVYQLAFRIAPIDQTRAMLSYLKNDVAPALQTRAEYRSDPLLSTLSTVELRSVVSITLRSLGCLRDPSTAAQIVELLTPFLYHNESVYREAALEAILSLSPLLDTGLAAKVLWVTLPLYTDAPLSTRMVFARYIHTIPRVADYLLTVLTPDVGDHALTSLRDVQASLGAGSDSSAPSFAEQRVERALFQRDFFLQFGSWDPVPTGYDRVPDHIAQQPKVSYQLVALYEPLLAKLPSLPPGFFDETYYHLQGFLKLGELKGSAMVVMSELYKAMPAQLRQPILDLILHELSHQVTFATRGLVHGSAVGLRNICTHSDGAETLDSVIERIISLPTMREGDIHGLIELTPLISERKSARLSQLVDRFVDILTADDVVLDTRRAAMDMVGELAAMTSDEDVVRVIEAMGRLLETSGDNSGMRAACEIQLAKFLRRAGPDHPLVRMILQQLQTHVYSSRQRHRLRAVKQLGIFASFVPQDVLVQYCLLFICDPSPVVRETMLRSMVQGSSVLLHKVFAVSIQAGLDRAVKEPRPASASAAGEDDEPGQLPSRSQTATGRRLSIARRRLSRATLASDRRSGSISSDGTARGATLCEVTTPMLNDDVKNERYLASDRFAELKQFFGLQQDVIDDWVHNKTLHSVMKQLTNPVFRRWLKGRGTKQEAGSAIASEPKRPKFDLNAVFRAQDAIQQELVIHHTGPAQDLADGILKLINEQDAAVVAKPDDIVSRYDQTQHLIVLLIELLRSSVGRISVTPFLARMHQIAKGCAERAASERVSVFQAYSKSHFLYSQLALLPCANAEQYNELVEHQRLLAQAATDAKANAELVAKRKQVLYDTEARNRALQAHVQLQLQLADHLSHFYVQSHRLDDKEKLLGLDVLWDMLMDDHRGVRDSISASVIEFVRTHSPAQTGAVAMHAAELLLQLAQEIQQRGAAMRRKRTAYMTVLANLIRYLPTLSAQRQTFALLVQGWDDADGAVRRCCIDLVQDLCEEDMGYVSEAMGQTRRPSGATGGSKSSLLMTHITQRVNNPLYPEKQHLHRLLKWYFTYTTANAPAATSGPGTASVIAGKLSGSAA